MDRSKEKNRRHRTDYTIKRWWHKVRTSRRAKRKLMNFIVIVLTVLVAFVFGFFYFGPSFSGGE